MTYSLLEAQPFLSLLVQQAKSMLEQEGCVLIAQSSNQSTAKLSVELEYSVDQPYPLSHLLLWIRPVNLAYGAKPFSRIEVCLGGSSLKPSQIKELACCPSLEITVDNVCLIHDTLRTLQAEIKNYLAR